MRTIFRILSLIRWGRAASKGTLDQRYLTLHYRSGYFSWPRSDSPSFRLRGLFMNFVKREFS